jgi:hypothetical protein
VLQEVKAHLQRSFSFTEIRGDGPIVLVPFYAFNVEVIAAFRTTSGQYLICITEGGGRYKTADYDAEIKVISDSDAATKKNTRALIRILKCWQGCCSVEIKSFWLEIISVNFLRYWQYSSNSPMYYDWMVRDYLSYLVSSKNGFISAPGTGETMFLGDRWLSKANSALIRAVRACQYESDKLPFSAGDEWQKIFGSDMPRVPNG